MMRCVSLLLLFVFVSLVKIPAYSQAVSQQPSAQEILARISHSVRNTNYRGRLTYEHSGKLELLEITHAVIDGTEYEKIRYLNGPDRAVINRGDALSCSPKGGALLSGATTGLDGHRNSAQLADTYTPKMLGMERVAGRESWHIQLVPRDDYRHSVILAIDKASNLPVKTLFVSEGRKALERLHFVSLETDIDVDRDEFLEAGAQQGTPQRSCDAVASDSEVSRWQPTWVPPGFVRSARHYQPQDGHMETYTDGIASFSVFAKSIGMDDEHNFYPVSPTLKKGATVVVMRIQPEPSPVQLSVLGEIPDKAASRILASMKEIQP